MPLAKILEILLHEDCIRPLLEYIVRDMPVPKARGIEKRLDVVLLLASKALKAMMFGRL